MESHKGAEDLGRVPQTWEWSQSSTCQETQGFEQRFYLEWETISHGIKRLNDVYSPGDPSCRLQHKWNSTGQHFSPSRERTNKYNGCAFVCVFEAGVFSLPTHVLTWIHSNSNHEGISVTCQHPSHDFSCYLSWNLLFSGFVRCRLARLISISSNPVSCMFSFRMNHKGTSQATCRTEGKV